EQHGPRPRRGIRDDLHGPGQSHPERRSGSLADLRRPVRAGSLGPVTDVPTTRFARNGDVHLAYQVVGDGPVDLLFVDDWVHHVELVWEVAEYARFLRRLSGFARLIHFDRRGTGLSDPMPPESLPDLE